MDKIEITLADIKHLQFAVVDRLDTVISLHQHPDAATRFVDVSPRNDLRVVEVTYK